MALALPKSINRYFLKMGPLWDPAILVTLFSSHGEMAHLERVRDAGCFVSVTGLLSKREQGSDLIVVLGGLFCCFFFVNVTQASAI